MKIYKKLFAYVQDKKYLGVLAIIFSAISALLTVYGYYLIYKFLDKLIINSNLSGAESIALKSVITLTSGAIFYFVSGMFSHILGFRLETNLRKRGIDGLEKASFRFFDLNPSGQIRKIIDDNAAQTHQVVAHMIPDSSQAIITPVLVLALGFIVSIRVGIILLALTIIGGLILGAMMGEQEFMKIYQESLSKLSAETVEYVRGMQVVKIFKANVESFKSFYKAIKDYSKYAYDYSLSCKRPYVLYQWLFFGLIAILIIPIVYFAFMFGVGMMGLIPILFLIYPTVLAIVAGTVVMLFMAKVQKPWALFIFGMISPLVMFAAGHTYVVVVLSLIVMIIAELIRKIGNYNSFKYNMLSYAIFSTWICSSLMQMLLAKEKYMEWSLMTMGKDYVDVLEKLITYPHMALVALGAFLGGILGAYIGKALLKKHFSNGSYCVGYFTPCLILWCYLN